jgi:hypothetical protein
MLGETAQFDPASPDRSLDFISLRSFKLLIPLVMLALSGCSDKPRPPRRRRSPSRSR